MLGIRWVEIVEQISFAFVPVIINNQRIYLIVIIMCLLTLRHCRLATLCISSFLEHPSRSEVVHMRLLPLSDCDLSHYVLELIQHSACDEMASASRCSVDSWGDDTLVSVSIYIKLRKSNKHTERLHSWRYLTLLFLIECVKQRRVNLKIRTDKGTHSAKTNMKGK